MKIIKCFILFGFVLISNLFSSTSFRVMTYNALNFPTAEGNNRLPYFQTVFEAAVPDILMVQEIVSAPGADLLLDELNANGTVFSRADFIDGTDTDNMLYYKSSVASLVSQSVLSTALRDISEYVMSIGVNKIRFYSCHLKASDSSEDEQKRLVEITVLRNHLNNLNEGTEFIVVGDMNFYRSSEPAYQKIIADDGNNIGRAQDLCTQVGNWHNNETYAAVHTQSTRTTTLSDGGSSGGLDDRFDFIFSSYNINNSSGIEYTTNSYTSYGNDGAHFNQSINDGTNSAVSADIADALYYASDHLPVYADFVSLDSDISPGDVIITGIVDGPLTGGTPKALELYISGTENMANYSVWRSTNGAAFVSVIAAGSMSGSFTDEFVYLTNNLASFEEVFGTSGDFANTIYDYDISGNGNDGFQIRNSAGTVVIDQVWKEDTNDYYLDSYINRKDFTGPDGAWFVGNWDAGGNNALDGMDAAQIASAVGWGTYTLPVTLSTFTAQYLNSKPTLYWQTQSEIDNMGWFIYRNTTEDFTSAEKITGMIEGHGTTTEPQSYIYEDEEELQIEQTYYYWLESVDYSGTIHHYDRVAQVTIPHPNEPGQNVIPPVAYEISADPNPFSYTTNISFVMDQPSIVDVAIYNVKGQLVKSFNSVMSSQENETVAFSWNGKNDAGKSLSNGVYLYLVKVNGKDYAYKQLILMK